MNTLSTGITQSSRMLQMDTPLGEDILLPECLYLNEGISFLFEMRINVQSKRFDIKPDELVGKKIDISVDIDGLAVRSWNGLVTALHEGPVVQRGLRGYSLVVHPDIWLLSQKSDCRIWMDMTSVEIVSTLFAEHNLPSPQFAQMHPEPLPQHYSVQWNETDLAYLIRRLEEDGIFYWFVHERGNHKMHLANHAMSYQKNESLSNVRIAPGEDHHFRRIYEWKRSFNFIPGKRTVADWNFQTPRHVPAGESPSKVKLPKNDRYELYEFPSRALDRNSNDRASLLRMQAREHEHDQIEGKANIPELTSALRFTPVSPFDDTYDECVITRICHRVVDPSYGNSEQNSAYENEFKAIPAQVSATPRRRAPRPRIEGNQIAIVAGPEGAEIHPDEFGRVKVWFPWDRRAKKNGSDTCWVRVAQSWAGQAWGTQIIPRVGMEVIISYLEGDPDRPVITGHVPNPQQKVPYPLPAHKTKSVFRTNSHQAKGYNELSFEDDTGQENMFFHAQKDQTIKVLHNRAKRINQHEVESIGANQSLEVEGNQQEKIGGSRNLFVGGGPGISVLGMVAGVLAAGSEHSTAGSAGVGNSLLSQFVGALASASALAESLSLVANKEFNQAANHLREAGKDQAVASESLGELLSQIMPLTGVLTNVIEKFQADTIGIARTEQIGAYKNTTVGHTQTTNVGKRQHTDIGESQATHVGKTKKTIVGEEYVIEVGKASLIMKKDGTIVLKGVDITVSGDGEIGILAKKNITEKGKKILKN